MYLTMLASLLEEYILSVQTGTNSSGNLNKLEMKPHQEEFGTAVKATSDFEEVNLVLIKPSNPKIAEETVQSQLITLGVLEACFERAQFYLKNQNMFRTMVLAVCEASASDNIEVRLKGLILLVKTAKFGYEYLKDYIDAFATTISAINSDEARIKVQGIAFWQTISQFEDPRDSEGRKVENHVKSYGLVKKNLDKLIPALFNELIRGEFSDHSSVENLQVIKVHNRDKDETSESNDKLQSALSDCDASDSKKDSTHHPYVNDDDLWTPPKEVIIYFSELCEDYPDAIDCHVLPVAKSQIESHEWKRRNAALWSLLVFLKQMDAQHADRILEPLFVLVRGSLKDSNSRIRNTSLWVISWMLDKCPRLAICKNSHDLKLFVDELITCLNDDEGRVSPSSCTTLTSLVHAAYSLQSEEKHVRPLTFILSPHYKMITDELVKAASRRGLLTAAFVALREILLSSPTDCYWVVLGTTDRLLESLRKTIEIAEGRRCRCYENLRSLLCGILHNIVKTLKVGETATNELCHKFMSCILSLVTLYPTGVAREEALKSASTIAILLDLELDQHLRKLLPYLTSSISSLSNDDPVLPLAIKLVGNLFLALKSNSVLYLSRFMGPLLTLTDRNRNVKMDILICCVATFGQIATAVGRPGFQIYMAAVLRRLHYCCELSVDEIIEENDQSKILRETLRQTCFETLSCLVKSILQRGAQSTTLELSSNSLCLKIISILIVSVVHSKTRLPDQTLNAAAHLIGNLLSELGIQALVHIPLNIEECQILLSDTIKRNIPREVEGVCRVALLELETTGRQLN